MDDISIAELLRQNNVGSWVEMAENIHPGFRTELVCLGGPKDGRMTATYRNDVGRVLVSFAASSVSRLKFALKVTYARLRDWEIRVECKPLETWVRSNVSAANVEHAFRKARRPETILSDGEVLDWLAKASAVNDEFCKQIRFAMLRRGADDPPTEAQLQALQVSMPGLTSSLGVLKSAPDEVHQHGQYVRQRVCESCRVFGKRDGWERRLRNRSSGIRQAEEAEGGKEGEEECGRRRSCPATENIGTERTDGGSGACEGDEQSRG